MEEKLSDLTEVVKKLSERLESIECKVCDTRTVNHETGSSGQGPDLNNPGSEASASPSGDIQRQFEVIRDSLNRIQLPADCKVNDSQQGIKSKCKSTLKVVAKTARFAETGLKAISCLTQDPVSGNYVIPPAELDRLYVIFQAQVNYLQAEYSGLVVRSTFDEETGRLFRSFQNNAQAFSDRSLQNVRLAAELASLSARTRGSSNRGQRANYSYASQRRPFGRGGGRGFRTYHPSQQATPNFPDRPIETPDT